MRSARDQASTGAASNTNWVTTWGSIPARRGNASLASRAWSSVACGDPRMALGVTGEIKPGKAVLLEQAQYQQIETGMKRSGGWLEIAADHQCAPDARLAGGPGQ